MALDNNDIKQLIAILQRGLTQDTEIVEDISLTKQKKKTTKPGTNKLIKPKKKYLNKFSSMNEFNMCKEDVEFDKKIRKPPPSERKPAFEFIKTQCRVCGKQENIVPSLVDSMERYKCNKCSTGAG